MPRALLLLLALAPLAAQAQPDAEAFELLRSAYVAVFDEPAYRFDFEIEAADADTSTVTTGEATSQVSFETGLPVFVATFDDGETRRAAFDGEVYAVDFPRTQSVYVDSTGEEMWTGAAWALMMHPAFGVTLHFFVEDARAAKVVGPDVVAGRPCTRATFSVPLDAGEGEVGICVDAETRFPVEVRLDDPDGSRVAVRLTAVEPVAERPPEAFRLDASDGFARVPYVDETPPLAVGAVAPAFTAAGAEGPISLGDYRGRYVLLDFWGTWCPPCVAEIPDLQAKADAYPDLVVLGLAAHEYPDADPAAFAAARGGAYPVARADDATVAAYRVAAFPTYYLVGPDGAVLFASVADRDPGAADALDALLAELFPD